MDNAMKWYDRPWAALIFFTRLPLWRIHQPPKECYSSVVEWWPLAGWLTGAVMAGTLFAASLCLPYAVAVLLAIVARMLLTGAFHEDGLADFIDGFGGGVQRERILDIMKDSHIGTYGVLGLVLYTLLLASALFSLPPSLAALTILSADPFAKMLSSLLVMTMPYARREEDAKSKTVYRTIHWPAAISLAVQGLLPMAPCLMHGGLSTMSFALRIIIPLLVMLFLYQLIWRRLHGYTGDCCGALCLVIELSVYITVCSLL